ncbi:hypothetical protein ACFL0V_03055 [Nanoarchaeota archaeon]
MKKRLDIEEGILLAVVIFAAVAVLVPGVGLTEFFITLLSVSSFLFGIFVAFFISDRHSRIKRIQELLREQDANILNIYKLSGEYGKKEQGKIRKLLDNWVISTVDYYLKDFHKTMPDFLKVYDHCLALKKNKSRPIIYDQIIYELKDSSKTYKRLTYLLRDKLSVIEWGSITLLSVIMLICLFAINTNTIFSIPIIVLLSISIVAILLVLRDLDQLFWKEHIWIWDPVTQLFQELDLMPYYPDEAIDLKRYKPPKGMKYRKAIYTTPYPDMTGKKVEIKIAK